MNMNPLHVVSPLTLNVYVKETILLTLNRSRRIISCIVLGVLFTCVLLGLSSAPIYAASEEDPLSSSEVPSLVVPEEFKDPVYEKLAAGDFRATYTVSDVYVLLSSALVGESNSSTYSLPRIAYYTWQTWSRLSTTNSRLLDISNYLDAAFGSGFYRASTTPGYTVWDYTADTLADYLPLIYSSSQQIHSDGQNNSYYLSQISSKLSSYNWQPSTFSYLGATETRYGTNYLSVNSRSNDLYFVYTSSAYNPRPSLLRFFLPYISGRNLSYPDLTLEGVYVPDVGGVAIDKDSYFLEYADNGIYLYLFDFNHIYSGQRLYFHILANSSYPNAITQTTASVVYLSFDTDEYQQIKQAFSSLKTANSIGSVSDAAESLANYLVSPEKQAAENASQPVIDDTLSGFTGSGSAAAKTSDTGGMKNMSGSIQSGLDTGASASNAASVFSNTTFWSWFTQDNANKINQPYPAPVVPQTRGSGDEIVDFLSGNQAELNELLNQRNSW